MTRQFSKYLSAPKESSISGYIVWWESLQVYDRGYRCWILRPYSNLSGSRLVVEYSPGYGVTFNVGTTNGSSAVVRLFLEPDDADEFDKWVAECNESGRIWDAPPIKY